MVFHKSLLLVVIVANVHWKVTEIFQVVKTDYVTHSHSTTFQILFIEHLRSYELCETQRKLIIFNIFQLLDLVFKIIADDFPQANFRLSQILVIILLFISLVFLLQFDSLIIIFLFGMKIELLILFDLFEFHFNKLFYLPMVNYFWKRLWLVLKLLLFLLGIILRLVGQNSSR